MLSFNASFGYLEGLMRGFKTSLMGATEYQTLLECDSLADVKLLVHQLSPDYGLDDLRTIKPHTLLRRCTARLAEEFVQLEAQADEPLATFLAFVRHGYIIDNVILLLSAALHEGGGGGGDQNGGGGGGGLSSMLDRCHPLGTFEGLKALSVVSSVSELYHIVLIDSPLAEYVQDERLNEEDLSELNIEILRNTLHKAHLEKFHAFCQDVVGGYTAQVMCPILAFDADRRVVNVTLNSLGTSFTDTDRSRVFPRLGALYPEAQGRLARADSPDQVRAAVDHVPHLRAAFAAATGRQTLEDAFFEHELALCRGAFEAQFSFAAFAAYFRLREAEIRNLVWICECIAQGRREDVGKLCV